MSAYWLSGSSWFFCRSSMRWSASACRRSIFPLGLGAGVLGPLDRIVGPLAGPLDGLIRLSVRPLHRGLTTTAGVGDQVVDAGLGPVDVGLQVRAGLIQLRADLGGDAVDGLARVVPAPRGEAGDPGEGDEGEGGQPAGHAGGS